jgi:pimeloyl-ACP methyl ester carboxylesterase
MLTTLALMLISALVLTLIMIGGVWWRQERIAYQPPRERPSCPPHVRRIDYAAADGQPLFALILEPDVAPRGVLLAFHGNADLAVWQVPWAREVARQTGWCVVLAEYRGYGGLSGVPSYVGVRDDARAAWSAAQRVADDLELHAAPFALFGHSLGSAVAIELAAEIADASSCTDTDKLTPGDRIAAVVLQSPFTSARDMARIVSNRPVQVVWRVIARVHYDTRTCLERIDTPISIAHGALDWLVPIGMGRELFARARRPGHLLVAEHAGHNDVAEASGQRYWQWFRTALSARPTAFHGTESIRRTETLG